jgi:7-carboxy-7-deazaguanine synthase
MTYSVKEIFYTLQGEGANTGTPAVFCRFAGCNLWSGREQDRSSAVCRFCDTDFVGTNGSGGGKFSNAALLADHILAHWPKDATNNRFVVMTGGEPGLQLDPALVAALHERRFRIAVETNGTVALPVGIDWVCVSPKGATGLVIRAGQELKLIFPQVEPEAQPSVFEHLPFDYFYLQPMDGPERIANTGKAVAFCREHPQWRLSVQTHKILGIP